MSEMFLREPLNFAQVQLTSQITWSFKTFHTIQITWFYSPMQRFWLVVSFLCARNDQSERTRILVLRHQYGMFQAQSHTSLKGRKNWVQTDTCCILKLVERKLSRAKIKYDVTQGLLQALIPLVRWSPRIIRQSNVFICGVTQCLPCKFVSWPFK